MPRPLVVLLHGYPGGGAGIDAAIGLGRIVNEKNFLLAAPDATLDSKKNRGWNAVDTCL